MKINFVSHATNTLASARMRAEKPVELLKARGHEATLSDEADFSADVIVFQKHINPAYDLQTIQLAKAFGKRTAFDVCDNHFDNPHLKEHYTTMCQLADVVMVNGPTLLKHTIERTGISPDKAFLVRDPITFPQRKPDIEVAKPKLLWFGHVSNIAPLVNLLPELREYEITIITNKMINLGEEYDNVFFIQWDVGVVEAEIAYQDIVLIPLAEDPNKQFKNTNRSVDSLISGKIVVTDSEQVYGELKDFVYITKDIPKTLKEIQNTPLQVLESKIRLGQEYVNDVYSDVKMGDALELALTGYDRSKERDN